jgi:NADP-dependent 3-hydroxy acid dehydrogenase YdfG
MASSGALAGKTAIITGASRGIGLACADALHDAGARLVLLGRDVASLTDHLNRLGGPGAAFSIDLAEPAIVAKTLATVRGHVGGAPDIIVNNAGQFLLAPVHETAVEDFQRIVTVNLTSAFQIVREFLADMQKRRSGHIMTIGSLADHEALPGNAAYAASKHGVRAMHGVLREELRGTGVRATLISPEHVDTQIWNDLPPGSRADLPPRARMIEAAAVADAVLFAATRQADVNVDELRISRS